MAERPTMLSAHFFTKADYTMQRTGWRADLHRVPWLAAATAAAARSLPKAEIAINLLKYSTDRCESGHPSRWIFIRILVIKT